MKRSIVYTLIASGVLLQGLLEQPAWAQIPSAQTNKAPAAAALNGVNYIAWKGKAVGAGTIYYLNSTGSGWSAQSPIKFAQTTQAPALAALGDTLYLAWRGQSSGPTDSIYYTSSTNPASGWNAQQALTFAETTAAPALAASTTTLYLAWTTATNTIGVANYTGGAWAYSTQPPATFNPSSGTAPALAIDNGVLYLAWVQEEQGTFRIMSSTLTVSESGASWSAAMASASSNIAVAPGLGVYSLGGPYLAWTPASGTLDYADWDDGSWGTPVGPSLPVPPGPLTPAFLNNVSQDALCEDALYSYTFSLVYAAPVSGETYDEIYVKTLFSQPPGKCTCTSPKCQ
jgi:hypothetical protein